MSVGFIHGPPVRRAMTKRPAKRSAARKKATKRPARAKAPPARKPKGKTAAPRPRARPAPKPAPVAAERIEVRNVNVPGYRTTVDARRYHAMKGALLANLPAKEPGFTQAEMFAAVRGKLPEDVFPGQEKLEWWVKCVQLDLEARGEMKRSATKPLRWRKG